MTTNEAVLNMELTPEMALFSQCSGCKPLRRKDSERLNVLNVVCRPYGGRGGSASCHPPGGRRSVASSRRRQLLARGVKSVTVGYFCAAATTPPVRSANNVQDVQTFRLLAAQAL